MSNSYLFPKHLKLLECVNYMQLSVIIPALNEQSTIEKILNKVVAQPCVFEIVVVNDGSTDNTLQILKRLKKSSRFSKKLKILSYTKNRGKGFAIRKGITATRGDIVVIQDADLEYEPKEFKKLIDAGQGTKVVYGSRILSGAKHAYTRTYLGNLILNAICNALFGSHLTDSYTCYKLVPSKIMKSLNLVSRRFEIEAEITAKILKKGIPIKEVAISYHPRSYEKGKKIKAKDAIIGAAKFISIRFGKG